MTGLTCSRMDNPEEVVLSRVGGSGGRAGLPTQGYETGDQRSWASGRQSKGCAEGVKGAVLCRVEWAINTTGADGLGGDSRHGM